jgi:3-oxoacyl-[acyl-carrier protein] reductase
VLDAGDSVYGVSRRLSPEFRVLQEQYPGNARFVSADLSNTKQAIGTLFTKFMPLDTPIHGFVNNAALAYDDLTSNLQLDPLQTMFAVNVFTPMLCVRNVIRNMLNHDLAGAIVHVSSISVHTGYKGLSAYASSKGALEAFSKNVAREWGERRIRSNCVVAGFMETAMSSSLSVEQKERIYRRTALKEATSAESVAATIVFLLSDCAKSITGQNVFVDAGTI